MYRIPSAFIMIVLQKCDKEPEIILMGNKIDLPEDKRKVKKEEA